MQFKEDFIFMQKLANKQLNPTHIFNLRTLNIYNYTSKLTQFIGKNKKIHKCFRANL